MTEPTPKRVDAVLGVGPRMVTLAPELPGSLEAAQRLSRAGALVAAGHTGASFEQAQQAVGAGVRFATHVFNAMVPMHHREAGCVAAFLLDRRGAGGLIAGGGHVSPPGRVPLLPAPRGGGLPPPTHQPGPP